MGNFTGKLAPGETNFIVSKPLTQAEADALYFPIDGDLGTAQIGVSMAQVNNAINAAITSNELLSLPSGDARYMRIDADFGFALQSLQAQYQQWLTENQTEFDLISQSLADQALAEVDNHRVENPAHTWEQISGKPETATRWPEWLEVENKPDFDFLYRAIGDLINWSELTGIPATFTPSTHSHAWTDISNPPDTATRWANWLEIADKPDFNALYRQISAPIDWSEIDNIPPLATDWNSISGKPTVFTPSAHASSHATSGTDPITPASIGAELSGTAAAAIAAHLAATNPHPQYAGGGTGGNTTYNIIRSSSAFVEEFDDFLSTNALHKLGWSGANANGWGAAESGNRFPGTKGVYVLGILGSGQNTSDYSHLRLGAFPVKPLLSEGYLNIEISAVVGLADFTQTTVGFSSRFGLLDTGAGWGTNFSILISAEYFNGAYNWVAHWRSGDGNTNRHVIAPVSGSLASTVFNLKIKIDCENFKLIFTVNESFFEADIPQGSWLFGSMSPIFVIQRNAVIAGDTQGRAFYVDKYLFRKNVSAEIPVEPGDVTWGDILNKPDFDLLYRPLTGLIDWSEITNVPATSGFDWSQITNKPNLFPPESHTHPWSQITSIPATATRWPTWSEVTEKPTTFTPSNHRLSHRYDQTDSITPIVFNNNGINHGGPFTDFNNVSDYGFWFVAGTANGPATHGTLGQYYSLGVGLGNNYSFSQYNLQLAIPRNVANPYPTIRYRENGIWGNWSKISAGIADSVPWNGISDNPISNPTTYGSVAVAGTTGTYAGIQFASCADPRTTFMVRAWDGLSGLWTQTGWKWYFDSTGALTVGTVPWARLTGVPVQSTRWPAFDEVTSPPATATRWPTWAEVTGKPILGIDEQDQTLVLTSPYTATTGVGVIYRRIGKQVFLEGKVERPIGSTSTTIATLPTGFRPIRNLDFFVSGYLSSVLRHFLIRVSTGGAISIIGVIGAELSSSQISGLSINPISFFTP